MNRRELIKRATFYISVGTMTGLPFLLARLLTPTAKATEHQRVPLPGAKKPQAAFEAACIGCGLCGEVCPPRCIEFKKQTGGRKANIPYINPENKGCILCGRCMEACPTDALTIMTPDKVDMGTAQIDRSACYPWVDQGVCGACVSICPLGERAIRFEMWNQYRPVIETGCVGCGLCVEVCPEPSLPIRVVSREKGTIARHAVQERWR